MSACYELIRVILFQRDRLLRGYYQDAAEEGYKPVLIDGSPELFHAAGCREFGQIWETVFRNLQVSLKTDPCQLLLCSDVEIPAEQRFFSAPEQMIPWTPQTLAETISAIHQKENIPAAGWHLDGVDLTSRYPRLFPAHIDSRRKKVFLYTVPQMDIPDIAPVGELSPICHVYRQWILSLDTGKGHPPTQERAGEGNPVVDALRAFNGKD